MIEALHVNYFHLFWWIACVKQDHYMAPTLCWVEQIPFSQDGGIAVKKIFPLYIGMFPILYFSPSFLNALKGAATYNDGSWNAYTPKHHLIWKALPLQENQLFSKHDKTYWILSSFTMELLWNKIIIWHLLYVELNSFRFLTHAFQSTPLCSSIDTLATHCTDNLAIKLCVVRPAECLRRG
jgi:hypothetical protein